ncbi:Hint domain-containing protein [Aliiroseovarius subalbicans]|uniref:Hint domain-containing protein n=1 Tax=Aliiroseovarius subalbicans TaxID=2925840 RepID=UPI001F5A8C34|nr:Hint domain-containing protein [Aliiroseovarius subalbicans]MCI2399181.1 Hint domain-containing protein [Aliiroseovarius subalbicans]
MFMQTDKAFAAASPVDLDILLSSTARGRAGLVAGTRVEAASGWRPVESLMRGDAVYTLDGGLRQIIDVQREDMTPTQSLLVPGGALDNCAEMVLMPGQHVMLEADIAEEAFGSPLVLLPALALEGYRGITRQQGQERVEIVTLGFDDEEIVYGNTGALLHCPATGQMQAQSTTSKFFTVLGMEQARALMGIMSHGNPFAQAA